MFSEKIIFMGTPNISSIYLQTLINNNFNIIAAFTQPPRKKSRGLSIQESSVHKLANLHKINIFTPTDLNNYKIQRKFEELNPELIIVMGYGLKLPNYLLDLPKFGCINIHVSLLPRWRGASPIEHSLMYGDTKTGITIFKLVEKMDAGPIIASKSINIDKSIIKDFLIKKLNLLGTDLLISVLPKIINKKINLKYQNNSKATYAIKISTEMRKLNFYDDVTMIDNKIRAFSHKPACWFFYNNERIKIIESSYSLGEFNASTILNDEFHIGCKNGKICPRIIQIEGKKPMDIKHFLRGFKFTVGSKINA